MKMSCWWCNDNIIDPQMIESIYCSRECEYDGTPYFQIHLKDKEIEELKKKMNNGE